MLQNGGAEQCSNNDVSRKEIIELQHIIDEMWENDSFKLYILNECCPYFAHHLTTSIMIKDWTKNGRTFRKR